MFHHFQFLDKMPLQFIPRSPSLLSVVSFIIRIQTNQLILTLFHAFSVESLWPDGIPMMTSGWNMQKFQKNFADILYIVKGLNIAKHCVNVV